MSRWKSFLLWVSNYVPFRIPAGKGVTVCTDIVEHKEQRLINKAPKYTIRSDVKLVLVGIKRAKGDLLFYEFLDPMTDITFSVSQKLFTTLFIKVDDGFHYRGRKQQRKPEELTE